MDSILTKDDWLNSLQCLGMAWHALRAEPTPPDEAIRFRMQQGQEVHARARELFPKGVFISGGKPEGCWFESSSVPTGLGSPRQVPGG